jgi:phosphoglycolate phosphatase-like HAD superfamily hydrolase
MTHLVWDWNGTLFHDVEAVVAATNASFAVHGLPAVTLERYRELATMPIPVFYERLIGRPLAEGEWDRLDALFHEQYEIERLRCGLAAGADQLLAGWRGTQSLLSMWHHEALVPLVSSLGLARHFVRVDGRIGPNGGHKAEHLVRHLEALAVDPGDAVVVGDSIDDAWAAQHVGARCVLHTGGFYARATLVQAGVPVVDSLAEAVELAALSCAT